MISAGEVGAVFAVKDEASPVLKALMDQFNALGATLDRTKLALAELKLPPGLNAAIGRMDKALAGAGNTADLMAGKVSGGLAKIDASVGVTQGRIAALKAEMGTLGAGVGRIAASGLPALPGGQSGIRSRGAGGEHGPFHAHASAGPVGMRGSGGEMIGAPWSPSVYGKP